MPTANNTGNRGNYTGLIPHQFKPGQSGNPAGRPKKQVSESLREQLEQPVPAVMLAAMKEPVRNVLFEMCGENPTFAQVAAFKLIQLSVKGDVFAMKEMLDRSEGKVTQKMDVTNRTEDMTEEELDAKIAELANAG